MHATRVVDFPRLDGGLNLKDLDYRLDNNQSPEMKNLWWQDGILQSRDGQRVYSPAPLDNAVCYGGFTEPFNNRLVYHISDKLYSCYLYTDIEPGAVAASKEIASGVPRNRGTFFLYDEHLYYKNAGAFLKIDSSFNVTNVVDDAYVPTIVMNASPSTGSGDLYQPENRLSPTKIVQYNAAQTTGNANGVGDGTTKVFEIGKTSAADQLASVDQVYFGAMLISETLYTVNLSTGKVTFKTAPPADTQLTFVYKLGVTKYQLPVKDIGSVDKVVVDGKEMTATTDYTVNKTKGTVTFVKAPPVTNPPTNNTVEITYSKENLEAMNSILNCPYASLFSGNNAVCIVLGGGEDQPNAFFWNGNDSVGMNHAYWPMSFYNLAGDAHDGITGFSAQYGSLLILKEKSVGKADFEIVEVEERDSISLTYTSINSHIGCDLPWSIQLIENNTVFANRSDGVFIVRDSSSARENNIVCISDNVNGSDARVGLLSKVRSVSYARQITSFDDGSRYWLCLNGDVYLWDYRISSASKPSWFYFTNIRAYSFSHMPDKKIVYVRATGDVVQFVRNFQDFDGEAIEKIYQFPPQFFDTYDRLKDVTRCILTMRADTDAVVQVTYDTDYETRKDWTALKSYNYRLSPRNLAWRSLVTQKFALASVRRPGCRHVRHFSVRLQNAEPYQDLSIVSAQIYFRYTGRDR
jgi:hypothetical protein